MLEFLTSKIAMMIAAIIILVSVLGIFTMIREDGKDLELRDVTDTISKSINNINSINGETNELITFQKGRDGIYLHPEIDGKSYEIILTQKKVMVRQGEEVFIEEFLTPVHLWKPVRNVYNLTEIQDMDEGNPQLNLMSEEDIVIERKLINIQGENGYMTFVYLLRG